MSPWASPRWGGAASCRSWPVDFCTQLVCVSALCWDEEEWPSHLQSAVSFCELSSHPIRSSLGNCASSENYFVSIVSQLKIEAEQHWTSLSSSCLTARRSQFGLLVAVCPCISCWKFFSCRDWVFSRLHLFIVCSFLVFFLKFLDIMHIFIYLTSLRSWQNSSITAHNI